MRKTKKPVKVCCVCGVTALCEHTYAGAEWVTYEEFKRRKQASKKPKKCAYCKTDMTPVEIDVGVCYGCGRVSVVKLKPPCASCQKWADTHRPCTAATLGECDCPKCQGLCECK